MKHDVTDVTDVTDSIMKKAKDPSLYDRLRFSLPPHLLNEYRDFVASHPFIPGGKTYLELFMRKKGLISSESQKKVGDYGGHAQDTRGSRSPR